MAKTPEMRRLEDRRDTVKMSIRTLKSDIANPARLIKQIEDDKEAIKLLEDRIHATQIRLETMEADHDRYLTELATINKALKLEVHAVKIRSLVKLAQAGGFKA